MVPEFGKFLILLGVVLTAAGLFVVSGMHLPWLGRLPGDIVIKKENFSFYFPITTCILVSVVLTLLFYWFRKSR
ncbi:MAG: DUF2905 domain-containing protein [Candidatus Omnitrophica bacterium]|nr:DUF2905 domain-containing protein [Candidatus Omnitrophota bacterium]